MKKTIWKVLALVLALSLTLLSLTACTDGSSGSTSSSMSYDDAVKEMNALLTKVHVGKGNPPLDIYNSTEVSVADTLADISTFPITVEGRANVNIEVAAATEMSSAAPDDWMNVVARKFNEAGYTLSDGRKISVSVRKITSGEVVTYMMDGGYRPDVFVPSNFAWGLMLESAFQVTTLTDRLAGNTAGILMKESTQKTFEEKYGDVTVGKVMEAALAGDILFAYTNPYTSSTGLNILSSMLCSFDPQSPVSEKASARLVEYQRQSPPVAYTTSVLRDQAAKGIIDTMVMEEQAYVNTPELKGYVYTPAGIRHDHPVYTFDYVSDAKQEAARIFVDYCLNEESQKAATDRGFNRHDDYIGEEQHMNGLDYLAAQKVWKQNKSGGVPIIAVFVADVSGSMRGTPLNSLQTSLINASSYIGSENYIGLVSYSSDVTVQLEPKEFDARQRAYFSGAVKAMSAGGNTATYDAVLEGLKLVLDKQQEIPEAKPLLFVLSDGQQNAGTSYSRVKAIAGALRVPIYTIGYNMTDTDELSDLARLNEATLINASSDDVINQLRNLFNTQL